jgi:hypothetical protein
MFSVVPQLLATPTDGVDQSTVILGSLLAILTITDYPNGFASFLQRLVRRFDPRERVAWSTAEAEDGHAPAAGEVEEEQLFDRAAHADVRADVTAEIEIDAREREEVGVGG